MAASSIVRDQLRPNRIGNSGWGTLSGQFVDSATGTTLYTDALAVVSGHFATTPTPRIVFSEINTSTNLYAFIATGRIF